MSNVYGLDEVLSDLNMMIDEIDEAMDEIAKEVATEILNRAIDNVDGANVPYKKLPYPVTNVTGTLKSSLKMNGISKGKYKVFADPGIANYAWWVHEGTKKMDSRPFLDDAVKNVMDTRKYIEIANSIIEDILDRR